MGTKVYGQGFTFDDRDPKASSIADMHRIVAADARSAERVFPYIGGEEVNESPTHSPRRFVFNLGELDEQEARLGWPLLMEIAERKVKPERALQKRDVRARYWWRFGETTPALFAALSKVESALVVSRVGNALAFARMPSRLVFAESLVVITLGEVSAFAALQSRVHELWARFFGSSMKDDLRYTSSDCFETFPFPYGWRTDSSLDAAGRTYYEHRATLMATAGEGLTKTYNRFHDPDDHTPAVARLRELHAELDRAVLAAYGWNDLDARAEFFPEHDDADDDPTDGAPAGRARRRRYRLRWPDAVRDEVLARLLELNRRRAAGLPDRDDTPAPAATATASQRPALV